MKFRLLIVSCLLLISIHHVFAQEEKSLVNWMTLEEAMKKSETQPKPILLDFYTSWCGWCKVMMKTTYSDSSLAAYVNAFFYPVKFDAEGKDTIEYLGKKYGPSGKEPKAAHELAIQFLQGKLMYPTTVFLNDFDKSKKEFKLNMVAAGYLEKKKIEPLLVFTLENVFRTCSYDDFKTKFEETYNDSTLPHRLESLIFQRPNEAFSKALPDAKKTLVFIYTEWCNACRVMKWTTFIDTTVHAYLEERFNLVDFNAESPDSILFKDRFYKNPRTQQMPFNELVMALTKNNLTLPTLVVLDENLNYLDAIPFYLHPRVLDDILHFYGDDIFKKKSWQDFMTSKQSTKD